MDRYDELACQLVAMMRGADAPHDQHASAKKAADMLREEFTRWREEDSLRAALDIGSLT